MVVVRVHPIILDLNYPWLDGLIPVAVVVAVPMKVLIQKIKVLLANQVVLELF